MGLRMIEVDVDMVAVDMMAFDAAEADLTMMTISGTYRTYLR
jgi:hypothetical protein